MYALMYMQLHSLYTVLSLLQAQCAKADASHLVSLTSIRLISFKRGLIYHKKTHLVLNLTYNFARLSYYDCPVGRFTLDLRHRTTTYRILISKGRTYCVLPLLPKSNEVFKAINILS